MIDISGVDVGGNPNGRFKGKDKEASKFNRVAKICSSYPEIDAKLRSFCSVNSITERKACAYAVLMMIETGIRIGNEDSAEGFVSKAKKTEGQTLKTYGLTTLLNEHVSFGLKTVHMENGVPVESDSMTLDFVGKKSVDQFIIVRDPDLIKWGKEFASQNRERWLTLADGTEITKSMVTKFVKKSIGPLFSPKDFRAFRANIEASKASSSVLNIKKDKWKKKEVKEEIKVVVTRVSQVLGNTPGIAKKAYINPEILHRHWNARGFEVQVFSRKGKKKESITVKEIEN